MINIGNVAAGKTIEIPLNTFDGSGGSITVTDLLNSDIFIYKNQSLTQRTGVSGVTVNINHDGHTGSHSVVIDLGNNDDAGFYTAGSDYKVKIVGATVDTQTLNSWIGMFSIENRFMRGTDGATTTKTGYSLSNAGIDAIFTRPSTNYDFLLRSLGGAVSKLVNRLKNNSNTSKLEIYKADDTTKLGEQTVTSDPSAVPVTELNTD